MRERSYQHRKEHSLLNTSFRDQLLEKYPQFKDTHDTSIEQRADRQREIEKIEQRLADIELADFLEANGIDAVLREREDGLFALFVQNHFFADDDKLSAFLKKASVDTNAYGYKGGAARALLLRNIGVDPYATPRDIDIVRLSSTEPYEGADFDVARAFMPDDLSHGGSVEPIDSFEEYFETRDLTINQVFANDEEVIATKQCIMDSVRGILRITSHEIQAYGGTGPKMLSKLLRFYAESIVRYDEASIEGVDDRAFENSFISPFWLAVQLDRACERGTDIARKYIEELKVKKQLPDGIDSIEKAADYLWQLLSKNDRYILLSPCTEAAV